MVRVHPVSSAVFRGAAAASQPTPNYRVRTTLPSSSSWSYITKVVGQQPRRDADLAVRIVFMFVFFGCAQLLLALAFGLKSGFLAHFIRRWYYSIEYIRCVGLSYFFCVIETLYCAESIYLPKMWLIKLRFNQISNINYIFPIKLARALDSRGRGRGISGWTRWNTMDTIVWIMLWCVCVCVCRFDEAARNSINIQIEIMCAAKCVYSTTSNCVCE